MRSFAEIFAIAADRKGGYTRITRVGARSSDSAPMAHIEWVDAVLTPAGGEDEAAAAEAESEKEDK